MRNNNSKLTEHDLRHLISYANEIAQAYKPASG